MGTTLPLQQQVHEIDHAPPSISTIVIDRYDRQHALGLGIHVRVVRQEQLQTG